MLKLFMEKYKGISKYFIELNFIKIARNKINMPKFTFLCKRKRASKLMKITMKH